MKPDDIEDLLTRYYEGVTSEAEEKELKRFFMEEEVSEDLLAEKELFLQLAACPEPEIPVGLEERLNDMIDAWDMSEKRALKEAYMQAQKALVMLSSRLNKGMEEVETVQEATGKIRENVYEQLNRINNTKQ